jgi:hypothetical protein
LVAIMSEIVGRYVPKHSDKLFELKERAERENLRNRTIRPNIDTVDTSALDRPTCAVTFNAMGEVHPCGNLLTISDRWGVCEDCRRKGFTIG